MTYRHSDSAARAGARAKAVVPRPGRARLDPGDRDSKLDGARGDRRHWRCLCMPGRRRSAPRFRFPHRGGGLRLWRAIRRQGVGLYESHNRGASSTARGGRSSQTSAPVRSRRSTSVSTQFRASSTAEARIGVVGNSALRFDCGHPTCRITATPRWRSAASVLRWSCEPRPRHDEILRGVAGAAARRLQTKSNS